MSDLPAPSWPLHPCPSEGSAVDSRSDESASLHAYELAEAGRLDACLALLAGLEDPCRWVTSWWAGAVALAANDRRAADLLIARLDVRWLPRALIALAGAPSAMAYEVAVALWHHLGPTPSMQVFFASGSARFGFAAALDARCRLVRAGALGDDDPLEVLLSARHGDAVDRLLAALVLDHVAPVAPRRVAAAAAEVGDDAITPVVQVVASVMPERVVEVASALASTTARGYLVAAALDLLDEIEQRPA